MVRSRTPAGGPRGSEWPRQGLSGAAYWAMPHVPWLTPARAPEPDEIAIGGGSRRRKTHTRNRRSAVCCCVIADPLPATESPQRALQSPPPVPRRRPQYPPTHPPDCARLRPDAAPGRIISCRDMSGTPDPPHEVADLQATQRGPQRESRCADIPDCPIRLRDRPSAHVARVTHGDPEYRRGRREASTSRILYGVGLGLPAIPPQGPAQKHDPSTHRRHFRRPSANSSMVQHVSFRVWHTLLAVRQKRRQHRPAPGTRRPGAATPAADPLRPCEPWKRPRSLLLPSSQATTLDRGRASPLNDRPATSLSPTHPKKQVAPARPVGYEPPVRLNWRTRFQQHRSASGSLKRGYRLCLADSRRSPKLGMRER